MPLGIRFRRNMFTCFHIFSQTRLELKAKQDGSTCPWESRSDGNDWTKILKTHVISESYQLHLMAKRLISNKHISSAICVDRFFWSLLSTIGGYSWMLESPTHSVTSPISICNIEFECMSFLPSLRFRIWIHGPSCWWPKMPSQASPRCQLLPGETSLSHPWCGSTIYAMEVGFRGANHVRASSSNYPCHEWTSPGKQGHAGEVSCRNIVVNM